MQGKSVHVVFQVLNFIYSPFCKQYTLLPIDKLILITLAKHKGVRGIFPMQETLAEELCTSIRYLRTRVKHLEKQGLLFVEQINRKNNYYLTFLSTTEDLQIPSKETEEDLQIRSQRIYRSPHTGSTDATINQLSNQGRKQRGNKKRSLPLSEDFFPSDETQLVAKNGGLTLDETRYEFDKFMNYYIENQQEKTDWQLVCQNWFIRTCEHKRKNGAIKIKEQEVRSTVPWYNPEHEKRDPMAVGKLLNGLATTAREKMNGQGGQGHGMARAGKGETKGN